LAVRRGVVFVVILIGLAIVASLAAIAVMSLVVRRGPSVPSTAVLVLRPGGEIQETTPNDVVGQLLGRETATVRGFVESLAKAKRDRRITAVVLAPSTLALPYWAKVQEMRDAVVDFRESGKPIVAFLEYGGDREYYLASAADKVFLVPTSPLDLTGVASYEVFLRGMFDKIGAEPDYEKIGDYKTAVNQLEERGFTPAHREMTEALNRDMYAQLVRGIAAGRGKDEAEIRAAIDRGPFLPAEALEAGLVDELVYEDQLDDRVPALRAAGRTDGRAVRRIEGSDYGRVSAQAVGFRPRSKIAVIYAVGAIVSGRSQYDPLNGALVGSDTLIRQIRRVRDDRSIKAIVLRIDSPGGSSVASDVIWRELMITRDQKPERPLIVSMSDLAASGGYYIAMPGQVIVAQPGTLTGSIGIYTGKVALGGTLEKLGVGHDTVTSGANADIFSPFERFSPPQRARIDEIIQDFYQDFVAKAATARKMTPEKIDAVARGRVWTGAQAKEVGLVDELGGLDTAVRIAKERAGIDAEEDVQIVVYPPRRSFYEALTEGFGGDPGVSLLQLLGGDRDARAVAALTAPMRLFRRGEPLALMPYVVVR
jgi:protease-4